MSKMENIAALLRDDMTTLSAKFHPNSGKTYTFKVTRDLADITRPGDQILVYARDEIQVVHVHEVHAQPQIDPDAEFVYQWAFQLVDSYVLDELHDEDRLLVDELNAHRREQVRDSALAALGINDPSLLLANAATKINRTR